MSNDSLNGLDNLQENEENTISLEERKKKKRAFFEWEVNGTYHKLKLKTSMVAKLENKYRENLLNIISKDEIPPLSTMLTIIQAAMIPWNHKISYDEVERIYESWVENNDGNQPELLNNVVIPTMAVSGFFTVEQADSIMRSLDEAMNLI